MVKIVTAALLACSLTATLIMWWIILQDQIFIPAAVKMALFVSAGVTLAITVMLFNQLSR